MPLCLISWLKISIPVPQWIKDNKHFIFMLSPHLNWLIKGIIGNFKGRTLLPWHTDPLNVRIFGRKLDFTEGDRWQILDEYLLLLSPHYVAELIQSCAARNELSQRAGAGAVHRTAAFAYQRILCVFWCYHEGGMLAVGVIYEWCFFHTHTHLDIYVCMDTFSHACHSGRDHIF